MKVNTLRNFVVARVQEHITINYTLKDDWKDCVKKCSKVISSAYTFYKECAIELNGVNKGGVRLKDTRPSDNHTIEYLVNRTGSNRYDQIRVHAYRKYRKELSNFKCENCSYDKHVEICHIKAISSFPKTATLKEVNDRSNIRFLCRNCHWEFDHGLLLL